MTTGTRIPGTGVVLRGRVFNASNATVLCWVQDEDPEIFRLGPMRSSPRDRDVDAVKAAPPATLKGSALWFKFHDWSTAVISGSSPLLHIHIDWQFVNSTLSDAQMLQLSGTGASSLEGFFKPDLYWGSRSGRMS